MTLKTSPHPDLDPQCTWEGPSHWGKGTSPKISTAETREIGETSVPTPITVSSGKKTDEGGAGTREKTSKEQTLSGRVVREVEVFLCDLF